VVALINKPHTWRIETGWVIKPDEQGDRTGSAAGHGVMIRTIAAFFLTQWGGTVL